MIDLTDYAIGVDVWEGDADPGWAQLKAGGVEFAFLRMNISNGALALDKQFHNWKEAAGLARGAYVVISPFITRQAYVTWIKANLPADCGVVALDVEMQPPSPEAFGAVVWGILSDLQDAGKRVLLYSGGWCYNFLKPWPKTFDMWFARYPFSLHPVPPRKVDWEEMRAKLAALQAWMPVTDANMDVGHVAVWQCTSSFILPGGPAAWPIDVNLCPREDFRRIFRGDLSLEEKVNRMWSLHPEVW